MQKYKSKQSAEDEFGANSEPVGKNLKESLLNVGTSHRLSERW